jgi:hypothetical protein
MDTQKSTKNLNKGGRPPKYKASFNEQARKLCLLGATDKSLADFFEVDEATINRWKVDYPGFCKSLKKGKLPADAIVAESLYKRATGYSHPDVDIKVIDGMIVKTKFIKYYPPDTVAAIFWLKNRGKENWREKQFIDIDYNNLTDDQLNLIIRELKKTIRS